MPDFLKKRWVYHVLIWIGAFLLVSFISGGVNPDSGLMRRMQEFLSIFWVFVPVVYLNFFLKAKFYDQRKYGLYFLSLPLQVGLGLALLRLNYLIFSELEQSLAQDTSNVFFIIAISTGLQYFKRGIIGQYQLQELRAKNAEMELNALKAQINPHFLFNNLNNIYAINQADSEKGSEMIMELAEVMRYHLEFSKLQYVSLSEEIQLIQSYIELEKLRFYENCDLKVELDSPPAGLRIAPLLLLPYIENAFKHGTHPIRGCFVHIRLAIRDNCLSLQVHNSIMFNKKVVKTHIGLINTEKRLKLLYPEKHSFAVHKEDETYTVNLEIIL